MRMCAGEGWEMGAPNIRVRMGMADPALRLIACFLMRDILRRKAVPMCANIVLNRCHEHE